MEDSPGGDGQSRRPTHTNISPGSTVATVPVVLFHLGRVTSRNVSLILIERERRFLVPVSARGRGDG